MKFKKWIAVLLALMMLLSLLAGCAKKDDDDDDDDEKTSTTAATEAGDETKPEKDPEDDPTKAPEKDDPEDKPTKATKPSKDEEKSDYADPLDVTMDIVNAKTYKAYKEATIELGSKVFGADYGTLFDTVLGADGLEETYDEMVEEYEDEYGSDYEFYYEVISEEKIDTADLSDVLDGLQEDAAELLTQMEAADDEVVANLAETLDISEDEVEAFLEAMVAMCKKLKNLEISAGYELEITTFVKGSELDKPEEVDTETIILYKADGQWVPETLLTLDLF